MDYLEWSSALELHQQLSQCTMGSMAAEGAGVWLQSSPRDHIMMTSSSSVSSLSPFQQRLSANRSPVESPPALKKALKRQEADDKFFGQRFTTASPEEIIGYGQAGATPQSRNNGGNRLLFSTSTSPSVSPSSSSSEGKENHSILKRPTGKENLAKGNKRRVEFQQSVLVFIFDKTVGDHVSSENARLSDESKDRREFMNRTFQNKYKAVPMPPSSSDAAITALLYQQRLTTADCNGYSDAGDVVTAPVHAGSKSSTQKTIFGSSATREPPLQYVAKASVVEKSGSAMKTSTPRPLPMLHSAAAIVAAPVEGFVPGAVDFTFFEDETRRLRMKFTIPLGDGIAATDVLVKANMTGNKVCLLSAAFM